MKLDSDITNKGKWQVRRKGAEEMLDSHNEFKEAIQTANNHAPGDFEIVPPAVIEYSIRFVEDEPEPQPEPEPEPEPEPDPPGDLVFGQDNSPIVEIPKPTRAVPQADPAYGLTIQQATDAGDSDNGASWIRNDYSRRQAFNADESCYIGVASNGYWWLYDTATRRPIMRLPSLAGSCEPIWHPSDPAHLYFHPTNGGMTLSELAIDAAGKSASARTVADFRGKLPWADVARCWMKDEGAPSFDGRYWCFQAETSDFRIRGAFVYDLAEGKVLGTRDLASRPDHVSMSASGRFAVLSGDGSDGTTAYDRDTFEKVRQLHHKSEHSDLGLLPNGHDYYVSIDYQSGGGDVFYIDIDTGEKKTLFPTYLAGSTTAIHFSGKAYERPGIACVSTYARNGQQQWFHDKVFLLDLLSGNIVNLCHHRSRGTYYGEPHATISPSGRSVLFNSNWYTGKDAGHCAYQVAVPDAAYG